MFVKKNKREVIDIKYHKSNLILALRDGFILIYDITSQKNIHEIEVNLLILTLIIFFSSFMKKK